MVEHLVYTQNAGGSNPSPFILMEKNTPTSYKNSYQKDHKGPRYLLPLIQSAVQIGIGDYKLSTQHLMDRTTSEGSSLSVGRYSPYPSIRNQVPEISLDPRQVRIPKLNSTDEWESKVTAQILWTDFNPSGSLPALGVRLGFAAWQIRY